MGKMQNLSHKSIGLQLTKCSQQGLWSDCFSRMKCHKKAYLSVWNSSSINTASVTSFINFKGHLHHIQLAKALISLYTRAAGYKTFSMLRLAWNAFVGILIFISGLNLMLRPFEQEKSWNCWYFDINRKHFMFNCIKYKKCFIILGPRDFPGQKQH